jgi:hypothetical protein
MKKTLIVLCSAIALVGCDQNRGGAGSDRNRDTGYGSSSTRSSSSGSRIGVDNSSSLTNANTPSEAPGRAGTSQGNQSTTPKN